MLLMELVTRGILAPKRRPAKTKGRENDDDSDDDKFNVAQQEKVKK